MEFNLQLWKSFLVLEETPTTLEISKQWNGKKEELEIHWVDEALRKVIICKFFSFSFLVNFREGSWVHSGHLEYGFLQK